MALEHPTPSTYIDKLVPGQVVRVQLVGSYVLEDGVVKELQVARPNRRPGFVGFVLANDLPGRIITLNVADLTRPEVIQRVQVPYGRVRIMDLQVQGTYVSDSVHRLRIPAYVPVLLRWR